MSRYEALLVICVLKYVAATVILPPNSTTHTSVATEETAVQVITKSSDIARNHTECKDNDASTTMCYTYDGHDSLPKSFSVADISKFHVNCNEHPTYGEYNEDATYEESNQELATMAREIRSELNDVIKSTMTFACSANQTAAQEAIGALQQYIKRCMQFIEKLKLENDQIGDIHLDLKSYEKSLTDAQSILFVVQEFKYLIKENYVMVPLQISFVENAKRFDHFNKTKVWETIFKEQKLLLNRMIDYVQRSGNISESIKHYNLSNVILTNATSQLIDIKYWARELHTQNEIVSLSQYAFDDFKRTDFLIYHVRPIVTGIFSLLSIAENIILLLIFIQHKDMRTLPNLMLINLSVVHCISVPFGVIIDHLRLSYRWPLGVKECKAFFFIQYSSIGISVYSIVMISVQRFLAVKDIPGSGRNPLENKWKAILMLATVWLIGFMTAIPHAVAGDVFSDLCVEVRFHNFGTITVVDLCLFCILPTILIAIFSTPTAIYIRRSVQRMPGQKTTDLKKTKNNRELTSKILFALIFVYFISYTPHFLLLFLLHELGIMFDGWTLNLLNLIAFCLRNLDSFLEPVALYIMSKCYRRYFNKYLLCRK